MNLLNMHITIICMAIYKNKVNVIACTVPYIIHLHTIYLVGLSQLYASIIGYGMAKASNIKPGIEGKLFVQSTLCPQALTFLRF